jgi:hypothetical protein
MATKVQSKPAAAGVAAPLAVVLIWVARQFDLEMPPEVATAFGGLLMTGAYWLVKEQP